ncbi:MAG: hypothetical protein NXI04_25580 [Planctomycetaceae bacterium]|nr:hypothetical protein [Planctomycetaceae bacterium]
MNADELFQTALKRRNLSYSLSEDGHYIVQLGEVTARISLENVRRDFARDHDTAAIDRFAEQLDEHFFDTDVGWGSAAPFVRYCLEPSDYATGFAQTLHEFVTDSLVRIFVCTSPDGSRITWISHDMMVRWGVPESDVRAQADRNMSQLVQQTTLQVQAAGDVHLGMLAIDEVAFKASLLLAPGFRSLVEPEFGWPVLAVAPARDFVYVLSSEQTDFVPRLGAVVMREYRESGYPITPEVLSIDENGITAIGSFARKHA